MCEHAHLLTVWDSVPKQSHHAGPVCAILHVVQTRRKQEGLAVVPWGRRHLREQGLAAAMEEERASHSIRAPAVEAKIPSGAQTPDLFEVEEVVPRREGLVLWCKSSKVKAICLCQKA